MDGNVIKNLGDWAEDRFSTLCSAAGVTRNKSTQDRSGWDYIIQFESRDVDGVPPDMLQSEDSARIQVKSKEKGAPKTSVKLTNALRFAKDPSPCFIVLFLASNGGEPVRIYARHFWQADIEAALKRARLADSEGRTDLHKIMLPIHFSEKDDHSDDLLPWIAATIRREGEGYAGVKSELSRNIGFEDGFIHGTISFGIEDLGDLVDHWIGLAPNAPIADITLKNRRFGLDARQPLFSGKPEIASMRIDPAPCRVRVRTPNDPDIWLNGDLYLPILAGIPLELCKLRVVADFLEIVMSGTRVGTVNISYKGPDQRSLPALRALIEVTKRAEVGPLEFQIKSDDRPSLTLPVTMPKADDGMELQQLSNVLSCLEQVTNGILPQGLTLSLAEIYAAWNMIVRFNGLVTGTDLRAKFTLDRQPDLELSQVKAIYFYDYVDIGQWTFLALVRRPIVEFTLKGAHGEFHCGPPRISDAIVKMGTGADFLPEIQELYRQSVRTEKGVLELYEGNYCTMIKSTADQ